MLVSGRNYRGGIWDSILKTNSFTPIFFLYIHKRDAFPNGSFTPILSIQNKVFPLWIVEWHFPFLPQNEHCIIGHWLREFRDEMTAFSPKWSDEKFREWGIFSIRKTKKAMRIATPISPPIRCAWMMCNSHSLNAVSIGNCAADCGKLLIVVYLVCSGLRAFLGIL